MVMATRMIWVSLIVLAVFLVGGVLLQIFLSKRESKWPGLVLPAISFLWSLLFIIPGIVKAYAYSMTEYILYENPRLSAGEAIRISNAMTQGFKGELFVFDLSFILWNLLSAISLGIAGVVYVNPYVYTAHAGMYEMIKDNALRSGRVRWEDFGLMPPSVPGYGW